MGFCSFSQIPIFWECIIIFIVNFYWITFLRFYIADPSFLASEYSITRWAKCLLNLHLNLNLAVCLKGKVTNFQNVNWHKYLIKYYIIPKSFCLKIHFLMILANFIFVVSHSKLLILMYILLHSGVILFAKRSILNVWQYSTNFCLDNCSVICTVTLCYVLHRTHLKFWHTQNSGYSGILGIFKNIHHYKITSTHVEGLLRHISSPGLFRTKDIFKTLRNFD